MAQMPSAPPNPFTVPHFKRWVRDRDLTFEDGSPVGVEKWCDPILEDIFARVKRGKTLRPRYKEVWLLIPQGNMKTTLMALVALYGADFSREPWIPLGASSRDQAGVLFRQASGFVERSVPMAERFTVQPGNRKIVSRVNGGEGIKVYPADAKTGDGVIPYPFALCDEGHNWRDLRLYNVWRGKLRKRGAQIVMISTAGEPGGIFEKTREKMRNVRKRVRRGRCYLRAEGATTVLHEFAVPSVKLARDIAAVKEANPLSIITARDLREDLASPSLDFGEWLRLTCNIPARSSKAAIAEQDWDEAESKEYRAIPKGEPIAAGFDVGWVNDTTAIVPFWMPNPDFRLLDEAIILEPPGSGVMLESFEIKRAFEMLHERNPIHTVVMDMSRANDLAQWLRDEIGCEVIDRGQGLTLQVIEYEDFMEGLRVRALRHTGGVNLRQHVMNAIAAPRPGDKRVFDRPSTSRSQVMQDVRVIDALKAAAMVHASAVAGLGVVQAVPLVAVVGR